MQERGEDHPRLERPGPQKIAIRNREAHNFDVALSLRQLPYDAAARNRYATLYRQQMPLLIRDWRARWGEDLPFAWRSHESRIHLEQDQIWAEGFEMSVFPSPGEAVRFTERFLVRGEPFQKIDTNRLVHHWQDTDESRITQGCT